MKFYRLMLGTVLLACVAVGCGKSETPVLTGIEIGGKFGTRYLVGETFDQTGMTVTATYSDGSERLVEDFTVQPDVVGDAGGLLPETTKITVEYGGFSATRPIAVGFDYPVESIRADFERETFHCDGYENDLLYRVRMPDHKVGKVPLVLFLHGLGESGDDNDKQLNTGCLPMFTSFKCEIFDSVVIAPQCPVTTKWTNYPASGENRNFHLSEYPETSIEQALAALVQSYTALDYVDENRVYVVGLSMGGFATWDLLMRHGELFAAAIPMCAGADPSYAPLLSEIPIYTAHGDSDPTVNVSSTREMAAAIEKMGKGKFYYYEVKGGNHIIWDDFLRFKGDETYPAPMEWLFAQTKA